MTTFKLTPKAGEIYFADLSNATGNQQGGVRPVLVVSNNIGNRCAPIVEGIPFTTKINKNSQPTHALFKAGEAGLKEDSILLAEQKVTINKSQLMERVGAMNNDQLLRASKAVAYANPIYGLAYIKERIHETAKYQELAMA